MTDRPKAPKPFDDDEFGDDLEKPTSPGGEALPPEAERPTVSPPFNPEEFARTSESNLRIPRGGAPQAGPPEKPASPLTFELDDAELEAELRGRPMRHAQITLTDEDELESARLRSVLMPSDPPPVRSMPPPTVQYQSGRGEDAGKPELPLREMKDRLSLGDYTGALEIAESILQIDPVNSAALRCAEECRTTLEHMYTARIGPMDRVPFVLVAGEQLRWLSLDHRAGFLLSHVDGVSSLEMILDVSGMPTLDALRILSELAAQKVIAFR